MRQRLLFNYSCSALVIAFVILASVSTAFAQTTSFTYQGRLTDGGTAANGNYDLQFALFDSLSGGGQVGSTQTLNTVAVSNGVFTVSLDFGANAFTGASRFLEISARPAGSGSFTLLSPRQQITSTPYAVRSLNASSADSVPASGVPAGSGNYIQNTSTQQSSSNFNISGNGTAGGTLSGNVVNATTQLNVGGGFVVKQNGDVGIGTTAPTEKLTIAGVSNYNNGLKLTGNAAGGTGLALENTSTFGHKFALLSGGAADDIGVGAFGIYDDTIGAYRLAIGAGGNVGIGTATPQAKLDVKGDVKLGSSGNFFATSGEEKLRIVRGVVSANGAILAGGFFSVQQTSTGVFLITFDTPFSGTPVVTATAHKPNNGCGSTVTIDDGGVNASSAELHIFACTANTNLLFHFIAIGPR
jgi:hypothetical protein